MQVETLNKAIVLLSATFPSMSFNAKIYDEMLSDIPDDFFLKAVYDFIKTTKEIFPGTNPIAILREKALSSVPKIEHARPKRTPAEMEKIRDMQEYYEKTKEEAQKIFFSAIPKVSFKTL